PPARHDRARSHRRAARRNAAVAGLPRDRRDRVAGARHGAGMAVLDAARGPLSLLTLGASFALRHPARIARDAFVALPLPVALAVMPAAAAWSTLVTARALAAAIRIGHRVRSAPILRPHRGLVVSPGEIAPLCSLVSDTHVTAGRRPPAELALDLGQW